MEIEVPRDANSSLEPQIIKKWQRRLTCIDEIVLSLTAKGLTTGEISAHFADVCGNRSLQLITAAEARGQQRLAEMNRQVLHNLDSIITASTIQNQGRPNMRADNSIHLIRAAQRRHEHTRATHGPTSKTRSAGSVPSTGPSQAHRYLPDNAPATTPCGSAAKSPTAATANSPTRTGGYAANSRAPLPTPRRHRATP